MKGTNSTPPVQTFQTSLGTFPTNASPSKTKGINQNSGNIAQKTKITGYAARNFKFFSVSLHIMEAFVFSEESEIVSFVILCLLQSIFRLSI